MHLTSTPDPAGCNLKSISEPGDLQAFDRAWLIWQTVSRRLGKVARQNLVVLILAVCLGRTLVMRQLAVVCLWSIQLPSCYKRLRRLLEHPLADQAFRAAWVQVCIKVFAQGRGPLVLIWDWTNHRDQLKSLWVCLAVGGRTIPLLFWAAPMNMGGPGTQRRKEDEALEEVLGLLPKGRRVVMMADRAFFSADRMRLWESKNLQFVLRMRLQTLIEVNGAWCTLTSLLPPVGQKRQWTDVRVGKKSSTGRRYQVVIVHQRLPAAKAVRDEKGHLTGEMRQETAWFLVSNLPPTDDIVALYAQRMQIEQTFRDLKSWLGLETANLKHPERRLVPLLWASVVGLVLQMAMAPQPPQARRRLPRTRRRTYLPKYEPKRSDYPETSVVRAGAHRLYLCLFLMDTPIRSDLLQAAQKSEAMRRRPQCQRRRWAKHSKESMQAASPIQTIR